LLAKQSHYIAQYVSKLTDAGVAVFGADVKLLCDKYYIVSQKIEENFESLYMYYVKPSSSSVY